MIYSSNANDAKKERKKTEHMLRIRSTSNMNLNLKFKGTVLCRFSRRNRVTTMMTDKTRRNNDEKKIITSLPEDRIELSTPGLLDQCSSH